MLLRRHRAKPIVVPKAAVIEEAKVIEKESEKLSFSFTKTEINRMSTADLQKLAAEHGISGAEEISGAELKKILIEKFGL